MPEVRIDPLSGVRVLVADGRAERPNGLLDVPHGQVVDAAHDPFAPGNEAMTPPEIWADRDGSAPDTPGWWVRVVPNKFPALDQTPADADLTDTLGLSRGMPDLLRRAPANGYHEVVVNSPRQIAALSDLTREDLQRAVDAWAARFAAHADAPYAHLAVNEGVEAGSTLPHTHAQIWALPFVPPLIARERERNRGYFDHTQGRNLVEDLLVEEVRGGERLIAIDESVALITPFASGSPYRMAIVPRRAAARIEDTPGHGAEMLYAALQALVGLFGTSPPLNIWVRNAPAGAEVFTWRIEIAPRLTQPAGFELGTGVSINPISPERAAAELREHLPA